MNYYLFFLLIFFSFSPRIHQDTIADLETKSGEINNLHRNNDYRVKVTPYDFDGAGEALEMLFHVAADGSIDNSGICEIKCTSKIARISLTVIAIPSCRQNMWPNVIHLNISLVCCCIRTLFFFGGKLFFSWGGGGI